MTDRPVVFVVDDDQAMRDSIAALVEAHGVRARTYASAEQFLDDFDRSQLGCLVTDVRMAGMSGLNLLERLKTERADLPIIVISQYGDVPMAVEAMRAGAVIFLEKPPREGELWENIRRAIDRHRVCRGEQAERDEVEARLAQLTPEETRVLECVVAGKANKITAAELKMGLRTVEFHRANVMEKMEAGSLAELVRLCLVARQDNDDQD